MRLLWCFFLMVCLSGRVESQFRATIEQQETGSSAAANQASAPGPQKGGENTLDDFCLFSRPDLGTSTATDSSLPVLAFGFTDCEVSSGSLLRVVLATRPKLPDLRPGSSLSGTLSRALYVGDREAIPIGSQVNLVIEKIERQEPARRLLWRALECVWNGPYRKRPLYALSFRSATLTVPGGSPIPVTVSFGRLAEPVMARPIPNPRGAPAGLSSEQGRGGVIDERSSLKSGSVPHRSSDKGRTVLILKLEKSVVVTMPFGMRTDSQMANQLASPGSRAHLSLMTPLSASGSREGDGFEARLVEPLQWEGQMLAEGSSFFGRVARQSPPRRLRRPGLLYLNFEKIVPRGGLPIAISSSLLGFETDSKLHLKMDSEGILRGRSPGVGAFALDLGVSYLSGKLVDDVLEEGIKGVATGVTSGTAATIGRYFAIATGVGLFLGRRGRDVTLEKYSELELSFRSQSGFPGSP